MRGLFYAWLAAWLLLAADVDGAPAGNEIPADRDAFRFEAQAPPRAIVLEARPASLQVSRSVRFDVDGQRQNEQGNLSLNLYLFVDADRPPGAYRDLTVTSAVTSSGEALKIDPNQRRSEHRLRLNQRNDERPYFNAYFNLPAPSRPCRSLRELRGKVTLIVPRGELKQVTLAPFSKYARQRVRVVNIPDSRIVIKREPQREGRVRITYDRSMAPLVKEVVFVDGDGVKIEPQRSSGGGSSGVDVYRYYEVALPDDGGVRIRLYEGTDEIDATFQLKDIPMPGMEDGAGFDLAVAAEPIRQAQAQEAEGGPGELKVEIAGPAE